MSKKISLVLGILLVMVFSFTGCEYIDIHYKLKHKETVEKRLDADTQKKLKVDNTNGYIKVYTHDKSYIKIKAVKYSNKKRYLDRIKIHFDGDEEGFHIYSKREKRKIKFKINYTITVPKSMEIVKLSSTNGAIKVDGDLKKMDVGTTNGSIKISGTFVGGEFSTTNGGIRIRQENKLSGNLYASTTNGSIKLTLDEDSEFKIKGRTTNGSISCDFPVKIKRLITKSRISGEVGDATHKLELSTTNGSIKIYKGH